MNTSSRGQKLHKRSTSAARLSLVERQQQRRDQSVAKRRQSREDQTGVVDDAWLEQFAPKCSGHEMPAKLLIVKKTGPNKVSCPYVDI